MGYFGILVIFVKSISLKANLPTSTLVLAPLRLCTLGEAPEKHQRYNVNLLDFKCDWTSWETSLSVQFCAKWKS